MKSSNEVPKAAKVENRLLSDDHATTLGPSTAPVIRYAKINGCLACLAISAKAELTNKIMASCKNNSLNIPPSSSITKYCRPEARLNLKNRFCIGKKLGVKNLWFKAPELGEKLSDMSYIRWFISFSAIRDGS